MTVDDRVTGDELVPARLAELRMPAGLVDGSGYGAQSAEAITQRIVANALPLA